MKEFDEVGARIERLWCDQNYNDDAFPGICSAALREARFPERITPWQIVEWALKQDVLPLQQDLPASFGQPPITIYNGTRFYIDAYFWLEGTTATHQHAFCGAFQVLEGSSIHSWYEFERLETINQCMEIGDIRLKVCELLKVGDIQEIVPGAAYIHSLFHLDHPSVTIVIRTHQTQNHLPQFDYRKPHVAVDPFYQEPNLIKKLQLISTMIRLERPEADGLVSDLLAGSDLFTSYLILLNIRNYLKSNQMDEIFKLGRSESKFDVFMEIVGKRHGAHADVLRKVFEYQRRLDSIVHKRSLVANPEQRFFLALLMNVEGRERIFELIKARFPDADPLEKAADWIFDLAQTRVFGANMTNALGIAEFDDLDLHILEGLFRDKQPDEIERGLETEFGPEQAAELRPRLTAKLQKLLSADVLQPLLVK